MAQVTLGVLPTALSIHRFSPSTPLVDVLTQIDGASDELFATLISKEELSVVCSADIFLPATDTSGPWRAIRVLGQLDFSLTGILAGLAAPLAAAEISIFAISSFDTDYLLVNAADLPRATQTLQDAGYRFEGAESSA